MPPFQLAIAYNIFQKLVCSASIGFVASGISAELSSHLPTSQREILSSCRSYYWFKVSFHYLELFGLDSLTLRTTMNSQDLKGQLSYLSILFTPHVDLLMGHI